VVWSATYDAFGQARVEIAGITQNVRFPGQYFDAETGWHYNHFRDYDPRTGRY
jgi:RHS repeat-associated protein